MRSVEVELNGEKKRIYTLRSGSDLWVHINGETRRIDLRPKTKKSGGGSIAEASGNIVAPMPGRILKLSVQVGDSVAEKQVVVVMEAMKMEYSLACPIRGVVQTVFCKEGQQVDLGQQLVHIEPSTKESQA